MRNELRAFVQTVGVLLGIGLVSVAVAADDWMYYGGDEGGQRFSALTQIDRNNVWQLELAWSFRTGVIEQHPELGPMAAPHATPILLPEEAGGHLVLCSPINWVIALDPATGNERWRFNAEIALPRFAGRFNCRGVTPWRDERAGAGKTCAWRLFMGTNDRRLIALDARTGQPCAGFGDAGVVDINPHVEAVGPGDQPHAVQFVSPPAIVGDVVVLGSTNNAKFGHSSAPSGMIRGFDARSGAMRWTFDTLIREAGGAHVPTPDHVGGANAWSMLSMDSERGLIFLPTGSPSPDFLGVRRPGDNRYGNSLIALEAATGNVVWHQQLVHHDVWDYDLPAQPILADIPVDGEMVPAVIQLTKMGMVFTFDRETGEPVFGMEERAVPQNGIPGDSLSPTQPFPLRPPPLVQHGIQADDAWGFTLRERDYCREAIENASHGPIYTPPTEQGTIINPGPSGGHNWGGGAFDATRNVLITPVSRLPFFVRIVRSTEVSEEDANDVMAGLAFGPPGPITGVEWALEQRPLMSPIFTPGTAPPWAELVAIDMRAADVLWRVPLGVLDKLMPIPVPLRFGTPISGGPIVTASGLVFIGATLDERFRAFDVETGSQLWEISTPTAANATPMTYMADGRQFVVISVGGHMFQYRNKISDYLLAFSLPAE